MQIIRTIMLLALLGSPAMQAADNISLPDMGDSSSSVITPAGERELGESLMRYLRQNNLIVNDPVIHDYIHALGFKLVANSDQTSQPYTFFVVDDPSINAFAAPGGYIGIHTGLIETTESESELAAVLAHEIAHITQKHMTRTYESASKHRLTTAVALLAAILVGQEVDQLTEAAIVTTMAANAQLQINFTRAHEKEADYIGIRTLANAGFNPVSMADFFERMQKASRLYDQDLPEFLSTHPVTVNRIADARNRARSMQANKPDTHDLYPLIKARIRVSNTDDAKRFIAEYQGSSDREENSNIYHYTLALAAIKSGQARQAKPHMQILLRQNPEHILYRLLQAEIQFNLGDTQQAFDNYQAILNIYPYSYPVTVQYATDLLANDEAERSYQLLNQYTRNRESNSVMLKLLSEAASQTNRKAEAYLYLAEYHFQNGSTHAAIEHLRTASGYENNDYYLASQIEARMKTYQQTAVQEK